MHRVLGSLEYVCSINVMKASMRWNGDCRQDLCQVKIAPATVRQSRHHRTGGKGIQPVQGTAEVNDGRPAREGNNLIHHRICQLVIAQELIVGRVGRKLGCKERVEGKLLGPTPDSSSEFWWLRARFADSVDSLGSIQLCLRAQVEVLQSANRGVICHALQFFACQLVSDMLQQVLRDAIVGVHGVCLLAMEMGEFNLMIEDYMQN